MAQPHILLIADNGKCRSPLAAAAEDKGLRLSEVADVEKAVKFLAATGSEMVFACAEGVALPELFTALNENRISVPVVALGPAQPVQNAVKAIRLGAVEYLSTPPEEEMLAALLAKIAPVEGEEGPITGDPKSKTLLDQARQFAGSSATVLLRGESGTGKEVYSRFIHTHSPRKDKPFVSVNCAAIPENLLESELFGHEKGAFSGALNKRLGKFQQADGGTLLLDEISEMDLGLQAKLLRAIQERVIDPVGATAPVPVDIRLIATTNRDIEAQVAEGGFREDLYFRLNVVMLEIPPLRERPGDILPLSRHYAAQYGAQNGLEGIEISNEAAQKLEGCYWKGNVRELENTIHRAVLMMGSATVMEPQHIVISPMSLAMMEEGAVPTDAPAPRPGNAAAIGRYSSAAGMFEKGGTGAREGGSAPLVGRTMDEVEKELILGTLDYCRGDRTHAADILGISIRVLRDKLKKYENESAASAAGASTKAAAVP